MRFISTSIVATTLLAGASFAEDHFIQHGGILFNPSVLHVEPGDVVSWGIGFPGGTPRTITSGEDCIHDGLYFDAEIPPGLFNWEVPMDIGVTEIPYFNAMACKNGEPGLLRIIDIRRVPSEYPTIQEALDAADEYDTILIDAGTYYETDLTPSDDNLLIMGELDSDGNPAVIIGPDPDDESPSPIMWIGDDTDGFNGLRFEAIHFAGNSSSTGGGVRMNYSGAVFKNCLFSNNHGGALRSSYGHGLTIEDCQFIENFTDRKNEAGGVQISEGNVTIDNCTFLRNISGGSGGAGGGAIGIRDSNSAHVSNCRIERNSTVEIGGGISIRDSTITISDCHFEGNISADRIDAGLGGGIYAAYCTLEITGCVVRDNIANLGGGLYLFDSQTSIADTRICGNSPDQIVGDWTDAGDALVQDDCSTLYVPEDFPTIDDAVDAARDGDTIMIAAGNYLSGSDFYSVEDTAVSIIGETNADGSPAVILNGALGFVGQGTTPIFVENMKMASLGLYDCTADVTNCYMVDGYENFAGVLINQAQGTLRNCRIADGYSEFLPGGVYITDQMEDSEIVTSDVDFIDCVIENNSGSCPFPTCGGNAGVRMENGIVDFVRCIIRNNSASGYGGISMASQTVVSLTDTTVCGNSSPGQINGNWTDNGGNYVADECPADCPGDFDDDGFVGGGDLGLMLSAWGTDDATFDLDGSGEVNGGDLGFFLSFWGPCT